MFSYEKGGLVGSSAVLKANPKPANSKSNGTKAAVTKPKLGLHAWMERVLVECDRAAAGFDVEAVHDLRVGLRRCRSLADGLMAIDPDSSWKQMKKAGKKLFQALGDLRDMQVMEEWIEKLGAADDPVTLKLLGHVHGREAGCKQLAFKDLNQFDRKQWKQWSRSLPQRSSRVRPGSLVYLHLALEKWTAAYELHKHALRSRSQTGWHELRIAIKRFRYTVENFLPQQHALWGDDLKELQDLLGEVHDLDVLSSMAARTDISAFPDVETRNRWRERINVERTKRISRYREKMVGKNSLWRIWRSQLPSGPQLRLAVMSRLRTWAGYLDPDFAHSQRVSQLALHLYDGLRDAGLLTDLSAASTTSVSGTLAKGPTQAKGVVEFDARAVLQAAAFMHDVGKAKRAENHHKKSYRMIRGLAPPLGWTAQEMESAAIVARYHRGKLPAPRETILQMLPLPERSVAMQLTGMLRLANALDRRDDRGGNQNRRNHNPNSKEAPRLELGTLGGFLTVRVQGYSALDRAAEEIAAARHLLETVLRRPLLVRPLRTPPRQKSPSRRVT